MPAALPTRMDAWVVSGRGGAPGRLVRETRRVPVPTAGEVLVRVAACGVCRTDLHLADGDLPARRPRTTPGHEVPRNQSHKPAKTEGGPPS